MPTEAELDWIIAVNIAPASTPNIGFENKRNRFWNEGNPFKQDTALLIVSIPQDVFIASGATVKPSLLFFKKFTEEEASEYEKIKNSATKTINAKYSKELVTIEEQLSLRGKNALPKEKKNELNARKKKIVEQASIEIKEIIKEKFDYEIPYAKVQKAGISTTGAEIENELKPLAEEYTPYRKEKNLWDVPVKETQYNRFENGNILRIRVADNIVSEPEAFYGKKGK